MLGPHDRLRPNCEEVAAKVMDGEAIIINLTSGLYYSMDGVGGLIWSLLEEQEGLADIAACVAEDYDVSPARAQADVRELAEQLLRENLVVVEQGAPPSRRSRGPRPHPKLPYEPPLLQTYRDMADLLALDPPMPGLKDVPWKEPPGTPPAEAGGRGGDG